MKYLKFIYYFLAADAVDWARGAYYAVMYFMMAISVSMVLWIVGCVNFAIDKHHELGAVVYYGLKPIVEGEYLVGAGYVGYFIFLGIVTFGFAVACGTLFFLVLYLLWIIGGTLFFGPAELKKRANVIWRKVNNAQK